MNRITLLTKTDCDLCEQAKAVLRRLGGEFDLEVETVDLATDRGQGLAAASGMAFPPAVFLDGQPFSYGRLSERKLRRELERRPLAEPSSESPVAVHQVAAAGRGPVFRDGASKGPGFPPELRRSVATSIRCWG